MKIVQSFILQDNNVPYSYSNDNHVILNFYSFLLSFITLKKQYGEVVAIVNKASYDLFMKFIPYDKFIFIEPTKIDFKKYWSLIKVNALKDIEAPFIHVDGDVMVFNDIFTPYIIDENYDLIVQHIEYKKFDRHYIRYDLLLENILLNKKIYKNNVDNVNPLNCGVLGIRTEEVKNIFINKVNDIYNIVVNTRYEKHIENRFPIYLEQHTLGVVVSELNLKPYTIIKLDNNKSIMDIGNEIGYTHLWLDRKYNTEIIQKIKNKIQYDYKEYYNCIADFESIFV